MSRAADQSGDKAAGAGWFNTTHWSVVISAADSAAPGGREALEQLCRTYWYPLYAYVRRQGRSPEDSQDLTQAFFARFLQKKRFRLADRERGKFRSFLLTALKHFLVNEWQRESARKRGGGEPQIAFEQLTAETHYSGEPSHDLTPEKTYERSWALTVLEQVRRRLHEEYSARGQSEHFAQLESFLPGEQRDRTYAETARQLGVAEGTLKSDVHRLKQRYREVLRAEIAHTVSSPAEINEELRHLIAVLAAD